MIAIYALSCIDCPDDIYIGSSKNIKKRMNDHKRGCNKVNGKKYNMKVYKFIRENGGFQKWKYHIIEEFSVYDKEQLIERENYWSRELKSSLNSQKVIRTKEELIAYDKKRGEKKYEEKKEEIKNRVKKYYDDNKEECLNRVKKYREDNKAKITALNICECGAEFQFKSKARHYRTKRHRNYLASISASSAPPSL